MTLSVGLARPTPQSQVLWPALLLAPGLFPFGVPSGQGATQGGMKSIRSHVCPMAWG